jgi:hypothetical protein
MITNTFLKLVMQSLFTEQQRIFLAKKDSETDEYVKLDASNKITIEGKFDENSWQTYGDSKKFNENTTETTQQVDALIFCKNSDTDHRYTLVFNNSVEIPKNHLLKVNAYSESPSRGIKITLTEKS